MNEPLKKRKPRKKLRDVNPYVKPRKVWTMGETSVIVCKVCHREKTRILAGKYKKDKKWTDAEGRAFNGKMCPACHSKKVYNDRFIKEQVNESSDPNSGDS